MVQGDKINKKQTEEKKQSAATSLDWSPESCLIKSESWHGLLTKFPKNPLKFVLQSKPDSFKVKGTRQIVQRVLYWSGFGVFQCCAAVIQLVGQEVKPCVKVSSALSSVIQM